MLSWYGRIGKNEEILLVPNNFYLYTCGLDTAYSVDPSELDKINRMFRNPPSGSSLENIDWRVHEVDVPDCKRRRLHDLCFSRASDRAVFRQVMRIFHYVVQKLDYVSRDAGKLCLDPPHIEL